MTLKILLSGAKGRMGNSIQSIAQDHNCEITYPVDIGDNAEDGITESDVVVDFSLRAATLPLAHLAAANDKPVVIGTTGHSQSEKDEIISLSEIIPIVWAGNFSTGVNLLFYLTEQVARVLDEKSDFDPEVFEIHHKLKKDSPSGTAERLLEIIKDSRELKNEDVTHGRSGMVGERKKTEIGCFSLRGGDVVGDHTVMYAGIGERIELTHRASDRTVFAAGALRAAKWIYEKEPGLYSMQDVLGLRS